VIISPRAKIFYEFNEINTKIKLRAFCANGKLAATRRRQGRIVPSARWVKTPPRCCPAGDWFLFDKTAGVADLPSRPDGTTLIAGSTQGEVKIANIQKREVLKTIQASEDRQSTASSVSPDGKKSPRERLDNASRPGSLMERACDRVWADRMSSQPSDSAVRADDERR